MTQFGLKLGIVDGEDIVLQWWSKCLAEGLDGVGLAEGLDGVMRSLHQAGVQCMAWYSAWHGAFIRRGSMNPELLARFTKSFQ